MVNETEKTERCKYCLSDMDGPTVTALGCYEYKCPGCGSLIIRTAEKQERTRVQFGAGKKVLPWY